MPFSVELFLDGAAESAIREAWDEVDDRGLSRSARTSAVRPHLTLGIWKQITRPAATEVVAAFAPQIAGLKLNFTCVGSFARTTVVFFAPIVTRELLDLHQRFHEQFAPVAVDVWGHYRPGHWLPHCTIGEKVAPRDIAEVMEIALGGKLPVLASVKGIGIVEHPGSVEIVTFDEHGGETTNKKP